MEDRWRIGTEPGLEALEHREALGVDRKEVAVRVTAEREVRWP
jgi:hypothetical protein